MKLYTGDRFDPPIQQEGLKTRLIIYLSKSGSKAPRIITVWPDCKLNIIDKKIGALSGEPDTSIGSLLDLRGNGERVLWSECDHRNAQTRSGCSQPSYLIASDCGTGIRVATGCLRFN
jgi:hypothetical protein